MHQRLRSIEADAHSLSKGLVEAVYPIFEYIFFPMFQNCGSDRVRPKAKIAVCQTIIRIRERSFCKVMNRRDQITALHPSLKIAVRIVS